ncbi:hypothetical protein IL306_004461 [Fusarium sp. DS 682]|nr:hypothetical protein IL306_004461 [Fusarium sp. DS 682]
MACTHQQLCKFSSPTDSRFQLIFWPHFEILVKEAIEYGAQKQADRQEEETMEERIRNLQVPTARLKRREINPDTIQGPRATYDEAARQEFLASLTGFTTANFADNLLGPQPGTCTWIERHEVFWNDWVQAPESRLLFITGAAGCGKTFLAKHIRASLHREFPEPSFVLAFFCNNTRIRQNESPILQYFIKELVMFQPAFFHQVDKRYRTLNLTTDSFHLESLMEILKGILKIKQESKIFLIIDGLDECDPAYIKQLLKSLRWIFEDDGPGSVRAANVARIAILSRPSPEIESWAGSHLQIDVSAEKVREDLTLFVEASLKSMSDRRFQSITIESLNLSTWIPALAGHSFLWADNIIKDLEQLEDVSSTSITNLCHRCPLDMEEYYNQSLRDLAVSNDELISVILDIVLWGRQPLTTSELLAAAGIVLEKDLSAIDLSGKLQRSCGKLLRINPNDEVAFVHHSLRDLLTRSRDEKKGHSLMASICLRYVLQAGRDLGYHVNHLMGPDLKRLGTALVASHPFLKYAQSRLFPHTRLAGNELKDLLPLFDNFLCGDDRYYRWWYIVGEIFKEQVPSPHPYPILQVMAKHSLVNFFGSIDIMKPSLRGTLAGVVISWWFRLKSAFMLRKTSYRLLLYESVLERDQYGNTLLHVAIQGNCVEFAHLWRTHSTGVDPKGYLGFTPLHFAVWQANRELVALLVDWGADPLDSTYSLASPLRVAILKPAESVMGIMLTRIPRARPQKKRPLTPDDSAQSLSGEGLEFQDESPSEFRNYQLYLVLCDAVIEQREEHVRLLLEHGVDPNPPRIAFTAKNVILNLHATINQGNDTIFDLLLDKCDLEALSSDRNPLHQAVISQRRDYVEKIIAQSRLAGLSKSHLDSRIPSHGGRSSVCMAASHSDNSILSLLLESGASPDTARDDGMTALHIAVVMNHLTHCELLINYGSNVNMVTRDGSTALSQACYLPSETASQFVATLLDFGADPQVHDRQGKKGPLHIAADRGNTQVIKQLLACSSPPYIYACSEDFSTPLGSAVLGGHTDAAKLLLDEGANVNIMYSKIGTPVLSAVQVGNLDIVKLVLCHGADLGGERYML